MKPRIYLKHSYASSGYQQWACAWSKYNIRKSMIGLGATPAAAYADWKRQTQ